MLTASFDCLDIDLLVLPDTNLILLASVIEPLRAANRITGQPLYRWRLLSAAGEVVETTSHIPIPAAAVFDPRDSAAPLFVLASYNWRRCATISLKTRLSRAARTRPVIAGIESGAWLLAEAGLLGGHAATVHWEDFEAFATTYPRINVRRDRYVIDARRMTTSGPLPTLDLMLDIVRRRQGHSLALEVSRLFVDDRARGLADKTRPEGAIGVRTLDARVRQAVRLMEDNIEQPIAVSRIARQVGVTARHLQDLFRTHIGVAPHLHYMALRLNAARRLVIETAAPLADIAAAAGFNSGAAFSRSYRSAFSESASQTRKRLDASP